MMTQKERNQEANMGASWATRVNNGASLCDIVDGPHGIYLTSKKICRLHALFVPS